MRGERLARGGLISLIGSGIAALSSLLLTVLVGQLLGAGGTGIFFQALGIFTVLVQILRLGTNTGIVRFIAEHRAFGREGGEWRIVVFAAVPVALVSTVVSIAVWFASDALARWMSSPSETELLAELLRTMTPFLVMGALQGVVEAAARMLRGVAVFTVLQSIGPPLSRLLTVSLVALAGATAWRAFEAWLLPLPVWLAIGLVVVAAPVVRSIRHRPVQPREERLSARTFWRFNLPRSVGSALEIALEWSDVLIVAAIASPPVAGVYAVMTRVIKAGGIVDQAMRIAVSPTISAMLARSEHVKVSTLHTSVVRAMILLSWPFYILTISMGGSVLSLFGEEFVVGWAPMVLLALSLMLQIACGMLQSILIQGGKSTWQMYNKSIAVTLSIVGNLALVPFLGIWGAAIAWLVVAITDNLIAAVQVHRGMGVHLHPLRLLPAMVPPTLVFGAGGALFSLLWQPGPLPLLLALVTLGPLYLAVLWFLRRWLDIVPLWRKVPFLGPRA